MRHPLRAAAVLLISLGILGAPRAVAHFKRDALTRDGPAWLAQLLLGISSSGGLVFDELIHDFGLAFHRVGIVNRFPFFVSHDLCETRSIAYEP